MYSNDFISNVHNKNLVSCVEISYKMHLINAIIDE